MAPEANSFYSHHEYLCEFDYAVSLMERVNSFLPKLSCYLTACRAFYLDRGKLRLAFDSRKSIVIFGSPCFRHKHEYYQFCARVDTACLRVDHIGGNDYREMELSFLCA